LKPDGCLNQPSKKENRNGGAQGRVTVNPIIDQENAKADFIG